MVYFGSGLQQVSPWSPGFIAFKSIVAQCIMEGHARGAGVAHLKEDKREGERECAPGGTNTPFKGSPAML